LGDTLVELRRKGVEDPVVAAFLPDVEVYYQAAVAIVQHNEFFAPQAAAWTLELLDRGMERAQQAAKGDVPWLDETGRTVIRAYRSRIDDSVKLYAVTLPEAYGQDPRKKWRVDVVLHGRDNTLTEVKFLRQHSNAKPPPPDQNFVRIDIFGRGNNAYRWA